MRFHIRSISLYYLAENGTDSDEVEGMFLLLCLMTIDRVQWFLF